MAKADKKNKEENLEKSFAHAHFSWYPGHMQKAKNEIIDNLKLIDIVIEIIDARIPNSSQNKDLQKLFVNKKKIIVLNKKDLADDNVTNEWIKKFNGNNVKALAIEANNKKFKKELITLINEECKEIKEKYSFKGRNNKTIRAMVYGIPNVGKSTFINSLSDKSSEKVENRPGVTKQNKWIHIDENIELMDTPRTIVAKA